MGNHSAARHPVECCCCGVGVILETSEIGYHPETSRDADLNLVPIPDTVSDSVSRPWPVRVEVKGTGMCPWLNDNAMMPHVFVPLCA